MRRDSTNERQTDTQPTAKEVTRSRREEDFTWTLFTLAYRLGRQRGLSEEEAQDCGICFVVYMLMKRELRARVDRGDPISPAWLHTCGEHWMSNFIRYRRRLYSYECLMPEIPESGALLNSGPGTAIPCSPEAQAICRELMQRLQTAALFLTETQRDLFARRFLWDESSAEIAQATGRSEDAIRQALVTLRRRMQTLLKRAGLTEEELGEYAQALVGLTDSVPTPRRRAGDQEEE